eukprot:CAMPEP_0185836614 /NCGR_PEP_ID=MMETSP1353-20130828/10030_1 /TAXON_ID=1077150 /ORGANISM="Erythrolobus australicus, Strain CCMP3124" /LENGTH=101 /DNA_ID=CAMNT_0028535421 /DNA_START=162 /DNA_END=464 /DNA_ORIENTATION=-
MARSAQSRAAAATAFTPAHCVPPRARAAHVSSRCERLRRTTRAAAPLCAAPELSESSPQNSTLPPPPPLKKNDSSGNENENASGEIGADLCARAQDQGMSR